LPASGGKENHKPEAAKSATAGSLADKAEKHTFCPAEYEQPIKDMLKWHYCAHLLIPGYLILVQRASEPGL
jgi:hypothetical protein